MILLKTNTESFSEISFFNFQNFRDSAFKEDNSLLIIDESILELYYDGIQPAKSLVIKSDESIKDISELQIILDFFLKNNANRHTRIYTIGGGTLSDLVGFASSIYKRGLNLILVPTTLLSMADASIGGKNAINYEGIKNLIGNYYLPSQVFIDPRFLETLSTEHFLSGLTEIVKIALTSSSDLFNFIDENREKINLRNEVILKDLIEKSVILKAQIVQRDFQDNSARIILNFGHTIGHSIELSEELPHGFAVAKGIFTALKLSEKYYDFSSQELDIILKLFDYFEIPYQVPFFDKFHFENLQQDKKIAENNVNFILLKEIGNPIIHKFTLNELSCTLENMFKS
jgi:3-dehydroquinate synthase